MSDPNTIEPERTPLWVVACQVSRRTERGQTINLVMGYWVSATEDEARGVLIKRAQTDNPGWAIHAVMCMEVAVATMQKALGLPEVS